MNSAAYIAWLDTLPPERRAEYGIILDRVTTIVNEARSLMLDDSQRAERRQAGLGQRQAELVERLDAYEQQRAADVRRELDRIRSDTISREEYDALMATIYVLTTRIQKLEPLQALVVEVQALEQRLARIQGDVRDLRARAAGGGDGGG